MADDFIRLVNRIDYPMFIVTACGLGERAGCLVGFATQTSIRPGRFLVCLSEKNHTYRVAHAAEFLGVHVVERGQDELAELFGGETGDVVDKLARCSWTAGPGGTPVLDACRAWFVGRIAERRRLGDHMGFLLEPVAAGAPDDLDELTFHRARWIEPGHPPT